MKNFFRKAAGLLLAAVVTLTAAAVPVYADDAKIKLPSNEAMKFVDSMGAGWNLGNTFDAANCTWVTDELDYENAWNPSKTTKELIKTVKQAGYNTIRIPVSWHDHVDKDLNISSAWMARVKEVVDWCIAEDLYVIINIHHDNDKNDKAYYHPSSAMKDASVKYIRRIWEQVSETFRDYSSKLVFQGMNEPRLTGTNYEWWFDKNNVPDEVKTAFELINLYNQTFVDTVRASGGKNKDRYLLIVSYAGKNDEMGILSPYFKMPTDKVKDRLIADSHYYGIGVSTSPAVIDGLYSAFTSKGIPAMVTEYGLNENGYKYFDNTDIAAARMGEFYSYARQHGISVVMWDVNYGGAGNDKSCKFIDRATAKVVLPDIVKAVTKGGAPGAVSASSSVSGTSDNSGSSSSAKLTVKTASSASKIKLSWTAPEGATKYAVYQYKGGKYKLLTSKYTKTSCTISKLASGKTYKFAVRAYINGKWSGYTYVKAKTK